MQPQIGQSARVLQHPACYHLGQIGTITDITSSRVCISFEPSPSAPVNGHWYNYYVPLNASPVRYEILSGENSHE